jgi:hypothetical protein
MINAEEPYFNGADPIKVLDTAVTEEPETEKAVVKTVKKRRPRK